MHDIHIEQPRERGYLRKLAGREYFIARRKLHWILDRTSYAAVDRGTRLQYSLMQHRSLLLRQLRNVDMYLQHNKVTNLRLAIAAIDGVIIKPGETFSLWRLVGRPTRRKGYVEGLVLHNGRISKGTGGGLCQLGNLLYWMALHTPLTITERWRHGYDVFPDSNRTIPFACGATLSYNYVDLQFRNDTNSSFQISLWIDDDYLNAEICSGSRSGYHYEVFETDHMIKLQSWGGYTRHNRIWQRKTETITGAATEELIAENHAIMMYNPLLS